MLSMSTLKMMQLTRAHVQQGRLERICGVEGRKGAMTSSNCPCIPQGGSRRLLPAAAAACGRQQEHVAM
jgi:hypothetical protein